MSCRLAASSQQIGDYVHVLRVELDSYTGVRRIHIVSCVQVYVST